MPKQSLNYLVKQVLKHTAQQILRWNLDDLMMCAQHQIFQETELGRELA